MIDGSQVLSPTGAFQTCPRRSSQGLTVDPAALNGHFFKPTFEAAFLFPLVQPVEVDSNPPPPPMAPNRNVNRGRSVALTSPGAAGRSEAASGCLR